MAPEPTYKELENKIKKLEQAEEKLQQAEKTLKERGDFLNTLIDAIPIPIFYKDRDGHYLGFNRAFEVFFGKTRKELIGKSVFDINPKHLAEIYHAKDTELLENPVGEQRYESQVKNANNELRDVIFNKSIYRDKTGSPIGMIGAVFDITERKKLEDLLKLNEQRYKSAQRMGKVGNWEYDLSTENFWGSDEAKRIYGFDPESQDFTTDEVESLITEREKVHQALVDLIENDKPYDIEFEISPIDQCENKIIKSIAEVVKNSSGTPQKVIGVIQDLTDLHLADEKLQESEQKFRMLFESSKDANYISTVEGQIVDANQSFFDLFNYDRGALKNLRTQDLYVKPNERTAFLNDIEKKGFTKDFEETLQDKNGRVIECQTTATFRRSGDGTIIGYQGIIRDVTDIKRKQKERENLIHELQEALTEVKTLSGLLPICSHCKKIRDDKGYWTQIESYIHEHSEAEFSHSICQECAKKHYPDLDLYDD